MLKSKKLRFSIFKRDNFTCQYCGKAPPNAILEVDHVVSRKDGGGDEEINLITACFTCNRGKGKRSVGVDKLRKGGLKKEIEILKEEKDQLVAYYDFLKQRNKYEKQKLNVFQAAWKEASGDSNSLTESGLKSIIRLTENYRAEDIFRAIKITWDKKWGDNHNDQFKYMCGVLKNLKLERDSPEEADRLKKAHSVKYKISHACGYFNEKIYWKWVNDGIDIDEILELSTNNCNWTSVVNTINSKYYNC